MAEGSGPVPPWRTVHLLDSAVTQAKLDMANINVEGFGESGGAAAGDVLQADGDGTLSWTANQDPGPHAGSHEESGSDEVTIENLKTGSATAGHVPRSDGLGSVAMQTLSAADLSDVSPDSASGAHHSKTSSASELSDVSADSVSGAHHSKTSQASELSDVSPDSSSDAHHNQNHGNSDHSTDMVEDNTSTGNAPYEIQKNGSDGTGVINFKT
jgi:hypothetical protein